jgi:CheY-like chemotaxis protein/two-component sensor histidine kinase
MDVSRVTRGLVQINTEPLDVKDIIAAAIEQVRPMVGGRKHNLITQLSGDALFITGDRTRMIQVVANLLTNAVRYTPTQGEIRVQVDATNSEVRIAVSDNGSGIDASLLPRVFDLFTQGARGLDRTEGGLGIGLALVKAIVSLHKGEVWAHSDGSGAGSTFTISIPRAEAPRQTLSSPGVSIEGQPLSILVVDDNTDAAEVIAMLLEVAGHQVATAYSATEALNRPDLEQFDVFLLDIGLPDMSGYDLARALRARANLQAKTYLALTGYGQPQDRELSKAAGFAHHFVKPVDNQTLFKVLAQVVPAR